MRGTLAALLRRSLSRHPHQQTGNLGLLAWVPCARRTAAHHLAARLQLLVDHQDPTGEPLAGTARQPGRPELARSGGPVNPRRQKRRAGSPAHRGLPPPPAPARPGSIPPGGHPQRRCVFICPRRPPSRHLCLSRPPHPPCRATRTVPPPKQSLVQRARPRRKGAFRPSPRPPPHLAAASPFVAAHATEALIDWPPGFVFASPGPVTLARRPFIHPSSHPAAIALRPPACLGPSLSSAVPPALSVAATSPLRHCCCCCCCTSSGCRLRRLRSSPPPSQP